MRALCKPCLDLELEELYSTHRSSKPGRSAAEQTNVHVHTCAVSCAKWEAAIRKEFNVASKIRSSKLARKLANKTVHAPKCAPRKYAAATRRAVATRGAASTHTVPAPFARLQRRTKLPPSPEVSITSSSVPSWNDTVE